MLDFVLQYFKMCNSNILANGYLFVGLQVEPSLGENGPVIIVCSTTGNADPPENCAR